MAEQDDTPANGPNSTALPTVTSSAGLRLHLDKTVRGEATYTGCVLATAERLDMADVVAKARPLLEAGEIPAVRFVGCPVKRPVVLDFSDLRGEAELQLTGLKVAEDARQLPDRSIDLDGVGRNQPLGVHVLCPAEEDAILHVSVDDTSLDLIALHRHSAPTDSTDRKAGRLGRVEFRDVDVEALNAARIIASDFAIYDVKCRQRLDLADAQIEGALEVRHSEIETWAVLPGRAGHIWVERCRLGGVSGSAMEVAGSVSFERVEVRGPRNQMWLTGSRFFGGISVIRCELQGGLAVRDCQVSSVAIEDSRVDGVTVLALEALQTAEGTPLKHRELVSPVVVASRSTFGGAFTLRRGNFARNQLVASEQRPGPAVFSLSSTFSGVALFRLGGPGMLQGCRFEGGADILVRTDAMAGPGVAQPGRRSRVPLASGAESERETGVAWLDLTRSWAGDSNITVAGRVGDEELRGVDGLVADQLHIRKMDVRYCRLTKLHVNALRIGSDVTFRRRRRPSGVTVRRPLALEVADEREMFGAQASGFFGRLARVSRGQPQDDPVFQAKPGMTWPGVPWVSPAIVRRAILHPAPSPADERAEAQRDEQLAEDKRVKDRSRLFSMTRSERLDELDREASDAEALASIYQQLSTAFESQGDAGMSADFYWQHTRWRRKLLGLNRQRERLTNSALDLKSPVLASQFGGLSFAWLAMVIFQVALGAGVRSRAPLWTIAGVWLAIFIGLSSISSMDKLPTCANVPSVNGVSAGQAGATANRNQTVIGCRARWGPPELAALSAEFVLPVASANPAVLPQGSAMRVTFYCAHMLSAVLLAFFTFSLRAKLRPRKLTA